MRAGCCSPIAPSWRLGPLSSSSPGPRSFRAVPSGSGLGPVSGPESRSRPSIGRQRLQSPFSSLVVRLSSSESSIVSWFYSRGAVSCMHLGVRRT
jgi:hypothetical protein